MNVSIDVRKTSQQSILLGWIPTSKLPEDPEPLVGAADMHKNDDVPQESLQRNEHT